MPEVEDVFFLGLHSFLTTCTNSFPSQRIPLGGGQIPESVIQAEITRFCGYITPIQNRSRLAKHILRVRSGHFSDQTLVGADSGFCSQDGFTHKRNIEIEKVIFGGFLAQTLSVGK